MDVKQTLDRLTPETERLPYWDGVLQDARPSRARWAAPRLAIVAAVLGVAAVFAVAPWKSGEQTGVLERALAAVGEGPVTHLVLRNESGGTLVDLQTGKREPLYGESEYWIDPERGMSIVIRFGGVQEYRDVARPEDIERPLGILASGYREALESGRARLVGPGIVDGIAVHWIQVERESGSEGGTGEIHEWALEVAVAQDSYEPVYVRQTRDGKSDEPGGSRILTAEYLPAGSGDFTPEPQEPRAWPTFVVSPDPISRSEALQILTGRAAWLGEEFGGVELAKIGRLTMTSGSDELTGVDLVYGSERVPVIRIQQAPRSHPALELAIGKYRVPDGHVVLTSRHAFLTYEGTTVVIRALAGKRSDELALAAARALRPLSAESGAGG